MQNLRKYIDMLDTQICDLVAFEVGNCCLMPEAEHDLHVLFENRKHACALLDEMQGAVISGASDAVGGSMLTR